MNERSRGQAILHRIIDLGRDPLDMIRYIRQEAAPGLDLWGKCLGLPQAIGGVVFIAHIEGAVILGGLIAMLMSAGYIHRHAPLSRLIGICQVWWLLTLPWLMQRAMEQESLTVFSAWLWYTVLTMAISIVMDVYGVHLFLTTDHETYHRDAPTRRSRPDPSRTPKTMTRPRSSTD